jgi:hypothetical protein
MAKMLQSAIKNYSAHVKGNKNGKPACFTDEEWSAWLVHESEARTYPIRMFACRDCTYSYQQQMTVQGKCVNSDIDLEKITD